MTENVGVGQYLAVPYSPFTTKPEHNDAILAGCLNLPNLFPLPLTEDEKKIAVASWITKPDHLFWSVWAGGNVIGMIGLTRIIVGLDALAHLAFWDRQLWGRRALVLKMMAWSFETLGLQRLSVEIPDHLDPLIRFCRAKLGFRYEGEGLAAQHPKLAALAAERINGPDKWVAKFGARREHMHRNGDGTWHDLVTLRVLREEFDTWVVPHSP